MSKEIKENTDLKKEHISKEKFKFVQKDEKIFDKKFETKPVGYFKDAMTRFAKNKTNVYATIIMMTMILLAIVVPITTDKRYTGEEFQLRFLPPRVPILENFGFMDGLTRVEDQRVDLDTIDPDTGLGVPSSENFVHEYIVMDSLENYSITCTDSQDYCLGGLNRLQIDSGGGDTAILNSFETFSFNLTKNPMLYIDIADVAGASDFELNFYIEDSLTSEEYNLIANIDDEGEHEIDIADVLNTSSVFLSSSLRIELITTNDNAYVDFERIALYDDTKEEPLKEHTGYELSTYVPEGGDTLFNRREGEVIMASFKYQKYDEVFGQKEILSYSANDYNDLIEEYGDSYEKSPHPDDPDNDEMWVFPEGFPIVEVLGQSDPIEYNGEQFFTYHLIVDYAVLTGYDEIPYFFFGTDAQGRDLFALSWVALRTSLFIAFAVNIINISIGVLYGAIEGYYGGKTDLLMERFSEIIGRIPWLVTLSIFVALLGSGITTLMFILIFSGWIGISSITRTQFYRYKRREYVLASRTLGAKDSRLIFRHILPNGIGTIITTSILAIPLVIFAESTISYLGFGIGHGVSFNILGVEFSGVSIGVLLADARTHMFARPYLTVFPAVIISILMITFNMFGNALRDAFNPSLRGADE